jgi:hypothetical protein
MDQPPTHPSRTALRFTPPGCLFIGIVLTVLFEFFVLRSIGKFFRRAIGLQAKAPRADASVAKARQRVRKATAGFNFAKYRYTRAETKLIRAQAALAAAQGKPQPAAPAEVETAAPEQWWNSRRGRFVIGSGKMLARYLLKQKRK